MRTKFLILVFTLAAFSSGPIAIAHHGFASYSQETITLDATITEFRFVNPHVQIYFDITNEAGEIEHWQGELTAPNKLARAGWTKNILRPGDQIQITGRAARNDGHSVAIRGLTMPNGESMPVRETVN